MALDLDIGFFVTKSEPEILKKSRPPVDDQRKDKKRQSAAGVADPTDRPEDPGKEDCDQHHGLYTEIS